MFHDPTIIVIFIKIIYLMQLAQRCISVCNLTKHQTHPVTFLQGVEMHIFYMFFFLFALKGIKLEHRWSSRIQNRWLCNAFPVKIVFIALF